MGQTIALQVKTPKFDYAGNRAKAQQLELNDQRIAAGAMDNDLSAMKLDDTRSELGAIRDFRQASQSGDPDAVDKLAGYPDMQRKVFDAFDGMSAKDYQTAVKKANAFGDAARNVLMFKPGTPEQVEAWDAEITKLVEGEFIPPEQGEQLIKGGPSDMILDQALTVQDWAKSHHSAAAIRARASRETQREKNRITEDKNAATIEQNDRKIEIQEERLELSRQKARLDADKWKAKNSGGTDTTKGEREDVKLRLDIERLLNAKRRTLGIDKKDAGLLDPDGFEAQKSEFEEYRKTLMKEFGFGPDGRRTKKRALGGDKVENDGTKAGPKVGTIAVNKATGERVEWTGENWEPVVEQ